MYFIVYDASDLSQLQSQNLVEIASDAVIEPGAKLRIADDRQPAQPLSIGSQTVIRTGAVLYGGATIGRDCDIDHGVVVREGAIIGDRCRIEHGSEIGGSTTLGDDNHVLPHSVIIGHVQIGQRNVLGPLVTIGSGPQHPDHLHSTGVIEIGDDTVIREYCTVHMPTTDMLTRIGSSCYLMSYNHVPHDAIIHDGVKMANSCQIGGHTIVMHDAYLGLNCTIHQRVTIGPGTMVGMGSIVVKDIPPFVTYVQGIAKRLNSRGALLSERSNTERHDLLDWYLSQGNEKFILDPGFSDCWWYADMEEFLSLSRRRICAIELKPPADERK